MSPPNRERLPLSLKLIYGAPSVAGAAMAIPVAIHVNPFYSDTVLVPLAWVALAAALARIFDAIIDPFVGWLSDHTHTRWGRRRPWIAIATPVAALVFVALFTPPTWLSTPGAATWFGVCLMLFFILNMLYGLPHAALGPELTLDYHERSTLFSVREGFALVGTLVAAIVPGVLTKGFGLSQRGAFAGMALGYGVLMVVLYWLLVIRVRERPEFVQRTSNPLVPGVRRSLRNRPFLVLFVCYAVANIPGAIPGLLMPYFNRYVLNPPPIAQPTADGWLTIFLAAYFLSGLLCLPLWLALAKRIGKLNAWLTSFVMGVSGGIMLFFLGQGQNVACLVVIVWAGSSFGAGLFLPPAIQADVIDYDELHTGKRREAQYLALWGLVPKFIVIPSASLPLALLAWLGYQPNLPQSPEVVFAIRAVFALTPAAFSIAAFFIVWRFPIDEKVHRAILEGVAAHGRGELAVDPLTGQVLAPPAGRDVDEETSWFLDYFSVGELKRVLARGARGALSDVLRVAALSLATAIVLGLWVANELSATGGNPGPLAVIGIVIAGFALTVFVFHLSRIAPALRLRRATPPDDVIRAHLAHVNQESGAAVTPQPKAAATHA
ncbi:MAG TPA: MFS transporter [Myxococcota bacterium]|nr:MFS transporter [Myxococcota bacterium]